ncbi:hypothetical protein ACFSCZ_09555 [Siminovitchia sediminis]|uniref:ABC transporter permease n=1 Tax=Siminovitchia sediminis TaxID=1274353 RepID=A0ABW4KLB2_9BACI
MKKIWLIWNNRTRLSMNKIVYAGDPSNQNKTKFWSFALAAALIAVVVVLLVNSFSHVLLEWIHNHLSGLTEQDKVKWISTLNLVILLSWIATGIYDQLYRFLLAEDMKLLVLAPISLKQLFIGKILERTYIKSIFFIAVLAVFSYQLSVWLEFGLVKGFVLFAALVSQFVFAAFIRFMFISTMVIRKVLKKPLLPFALLFLCTNAMGAILILYVIQPFVSGMRGFFFYPYYLSIYESTFVQSIADFVSYSYFPHSMMAGSFPFSYVYALITFPVLVLILYWLSGKQLDRLDDRQILGKMHELQSLRKGFPQEQKPIPGMNLLETIPYLHPYVKSILKKDLLAFSRDEKYRWKAAFLMMSFGLAVIISAYYFFESKVDALSAQAAPVFLSISVLMMLMNSVINKFSIDSEGMGFRNLVVLPVNSKQIAMAKIIGLHCVLLPFSLIYIAAAFLLIKPNFFALSIGLLSAMPVIVLIGLIATATFPNFSDDSLLNLPSTRAKVMISLLSGCYLFTDGLLFYFTGSFFVSMGIFIVMNVILTVFLFKKFCQKIEGITFTNFESLSELFD